MIFRITFDHVTANHCCMRPSRSTSDESNENVAMNTVHNQISGSKTRYDRSALSKWLNLDCGIQQSAKIRSLALLGMTRVNGFSVTQ